eukprot:Gregarina_sp_Pseudo_9__4641@NODE_482_length_2733_cov_317_792502_g454_i0_p1_GENE_NODE_482_length_2733_cov_317_792502_g454_i0NODE_482_length_2733_cov_317_792502_g454_i0_p1_ORF_typecomplete_len691_score166_30GST_N/PF02798_20/3_4e02GST_N/PF02798_20/1_1e09GST_N/PF02798_20/3_9e10GST_N_3/PF13417_6/87GST_N_3/PF13417_6/6_6e05GST_N_3/PF13417_6/0_00012GST_N_3/PF13417_6/3_9e03GST_C_3/PF14497_6/0_05GST_C_3/PF14497_6/7_4e09GST_C_2/PF13410_6/14GST_C_2/PF13410_6/2_9e02GST_C_2/PF13410_6/0_75GST_N_4/PF17172_4/0_0
MKQLAPKQLAVNPSQVVPTLYYKDAAGISEQIRFCFLLGGVPFNDCRIPLAEGQWEQGWKNFFPSGKVPYLEVNGQMFPESRAILLYAATKGNLMPFGLSDTVQAAHIVDLMYQTFGVMHSGVKSGLSIADACATPDACAVMRALDSAVAQQQNVHGNCVSDRLTYVDCSVGTFYSLYKNFTGGRGTQFSHLEKTRVMLYAQPAIVDYQRRHPTAVTVRFPAGAWRGAFALKLLQLSNVKVSAVENDVEAEVTTSNLLWPLVCTPDNFGVRGIHALLTWLEGRKPWMPGPAETSCKLWSLLEMTANAYDLYLGSGDSAAVCAALNTVSQRALVGRGLGNGYAGVAFSAVDVLMAVFYEELATKPNVHGVSAETLEPFRSAYTLTQAATRCAGVSLCDAACGVSSDVPKLYYYDVPGRAESTRLLLHAAGVEFEDIRFSKDTAADFKSLAPLGLFPVLVYRGRTYCESGALLRFAGALTGLAPVTAHGRAVAETIASFLTEGELAIKHAFKIPQEEALPILKSELVPFLDRLEKWVTESAISTGYAVEGTATWIDFGLATVIQFAIDKTLYQDVDQVAQSMPSLAAIYRSVYEHPKVKRYLESRQAASAQKAESSSN